MSLVQSLRPRLNNAFKQLMSVHWWMSGVYLVLFVTGTFMSQLDRSVTYRGSLYDFHKSIGVLSMALLTWRILLLLQVWQKKYTKRLPRFTPAWLKTAALHTSLYVLMWAVPITGYLLSNAYRSNNVKFFGIILPDVFPQSNVLVDIGRNGHFWLSYTFLTFIGLHMVAQWKVVRANWRRLNTLLRSRSKTA